MCGICGFNFEDKQLLKSMADEIRHRGPNAYGCHIDENLSLGSRRLSIIDLSKAGNQPMYNEDETVAVVYNGEIFNFKELRKELLKKGHKFKSNTDTEVIVHAYEEYGIGCLNLFNGFWGLALYDAGKRLLFLARDRLGLKPLYYYHHKDKLVFGSEIKSILLYREIKRKINLDALNYFLTYRYIPSEDTIFEGIKRLKPGHYAVYDPRNKSLKISKYWDIKIEINKQSEKSAIDSITKIMRDSVERRLISDVPLGVYLSGGIDSSSIVAFMKEFTDEISTYSLAFEHDEIGNELGYAKKISELFATRHKEIAIKSDIIKELPKIVWHLDEPLADPAAVPVYFLSKEAKKTVTVVLTGDGADELFAGYDQYKFMLWGSKAGFLPGFVKKNLLTKTVKMIPKKMLDKIYRYSSATGAKMFERLGNFMENINGNRAKAYIEVVGVFNDEEEKKLLKFRPNNHHNEINHEFFSNKHDFLTQLTYFDAKRYLPEDLLMKPDKMCMAFSIEARVPYLDYRMVEYSFAMPSSLKLRNGTTKYILKKALGKYLPKETIYRKKQPFQMPLDSWMSKDLKQVFRSLLEERINKKLFNRNFIKKIFENYDSSRLYYGRQLWSLGIFNVWHKIYIENERLSSVL